MGMVVGFERCLAILFSSLFAAFPLLILSDCVVQQRHSTEFCYIFFELLELECMVRYPGNSIAIKPWLNHVAF